MVTFPKMTVTVLGRAPVAGDLGRVTGERRPDPEAPEPACRRTFTAQYKLDVLAAYHPAEPGETGALDRHPGGGRATGQLVPAAPGQPGRTAPGAGAAP